MWRPKELQQSEEIAPQPLLPNHTIHQRIHGDNSGARDSNASNEATSKPRASSLTKGAAFGMRKPPRGQWGAARGARAPMRTMRAVTPGLADQIRNKASKPVPPSRGCALIIRTPAVGRDRLRTHAKMLSHIIAHNRPHLTKKAHPMSGPGPWQYRHGAEGNKKDMQLRSLERHWVAPARHLRTVFIPTPMRCQLHDCPSQLQEASNLSQVMFGKSVSARDSAAAPQAPARDRNISMTRAHHRDDGACANGDVVEQDRSPTTAAARTLGGDDSSISAIPAELIARSPGCGSCSALSTQDWATAVPNQNNCGGPWSPHTVRSTLLAATREQPLPSSDIADGAQVGLRGARRPNRFPHGVAGTAVGLQALLLDRLGGLDTTPPIYRPRANLMSTHDRGAGGGEASLLIRADAALRQLLCQRLRPDSYASKGASPAPHAAVRPAQSPSDIAGCRRLRLRRLRFEMLQRSYPMYTTHDTPASNRLYTVHCMTCANMACDYL